MKLPEGLRLTVEEKPSEADREALPDLLEAFNERMWPGHQPWQEVAVFVRDAAGTVLGGLYGETYGGWLFIRYLVMPEAARRTGLGRQVMALAEDVARRRGCHSAWLDTFSFQAPGFYRKLGYEEFGRIALPPVGERLYFRKAL